MKITKKRLRQIIKEVLLNEGVVDMTGDALQGEPDGETIITGPNDRWETESRDIARLEDVIQFLVANGREELVEPLRDIQSTLENTGYAGAFKDDPGDANEDY